MPESDEDYVQYSEEDLEAHNVGGSKGGRSGASGRGTRSQGGRPGARGSGVKRAGGFEVSRTWEALEEGADGTITGALEGLMEAGKRKRLQKDTTPLQRGIIRHLIVVMDLSEAMMEKDLRPTRHLLTIRYMVEFVREYFEQNPISQLGILGMRDGLAVRVSDMSGNPEEHVAALQVLREQEPKGHPSLQNALDMARAALFHAPSHGTREVLIIFGAIYTVDPGDISDTIKSLVAARITCTLIGLAAEVAICRTLVTRTNPSLNPQAAYSVALDELHYRELLMAATTPPPIAPSQAAAQHAEDDTGGTLLQMAFPSLTLSPPNQPSLCACHGTPTREGYLCPRCSSKACSLPTECRVCGMTLILSTHLARSYHHLFPLKNWVEVSWADVRSQSPHQSMCFGCQTHFPTIPKDKDKNKGKEIERPATSATEKSGSNNATALYQAQHTGAVALLSDNARATNVVKESTAQKGGGTMANGISESGRYMCTSCGTHFCIDCDLFCHDQAHNCPGCLSKGSADEAEAEAEREVAMGDGPSADDLEINRQILELLVGSLGAGQ